MTRIFNKVLAMLIMVAGLSTFASAITCDTTYVSSGETVTLTSDVALPDTNYYYQWVLYKPDGSGGWATFSTSDYTALGLTTADLESDHIQFISTADVKAILTIGSTLTTSNACQSDDCQYVLPTSFTCSMCSEDWCVASVPSAGTCADSPPTPVEFTQCLPCNSELHPEWQISGPGTSSFEAATGSLTGPTACSGTPLVKCWTFKYDWSHYATDTGHGVGTYTIRVVSKKVDGTIFATCTNSGTVKLAAVPTATIKPAVG